MTSPRRWVMRLGCALTLMSGVAASASAADLAVLINNGIGDDDAELLADVLASKGYEVLVREKADRADFEEAFARVEQRVPEIDHLLLIYFGETRAIPGQTWLVPDGYVGETPIAAGFGAVNLSVLEQLAASVPGRSVIVLGLPPMADAPSRSGPPALRAGTSIGEPPQGVLVLYGAADAAIEMLRSNLLVDDVSVAEALTDLDKRLVAIGFRSPDAGFVSDDFTARDRDTAEAPPAPPPVAGPAEAAEAALSLDQATRRRIQEHLTVLGHNPRGIDGQFGPGTRAALAAWQSGRKLTGDGFLNREQIALLEAEAGARQAELAAAAEVARQKEEAADAAFWQTTGGKGGAADFRAYLTRYPDGVYAAEARAALEKIDNSARNAAEAEDRTAWDTAVDAGTAEAFNDYLGAYPNGAFADKARVRIAALKSEPTRKEAARASEQAEASLGLNQASRGLIEGQLTALGFDAGKTDGKFDKATRRALREFQTRQGLPATGYVDLPTVQALLVASLGLR